MQTTSQGKSGAQRRRCRSGLGFQNFPPSYDEIACKTVATANSTPFMRGHRANAALPVDHQEGARHLTRFETINAVGLTRERVREKDVSPLPRTSRPNVTILLRLGAAARGLLSRSELIASLQHPLHSSTVFTASGGLPASPPSQAARLNCPPLQSPSGNPSQPPPLTAPRATCSASCRAAASLPLFRLDAVFAAAPATRMVMRHLVSRSDASANYYRHVARSHLPRASAVPTATRVLATAPMRFHRSPTRSPYIQCEAPPLLRPRSGRQVDPAALAQPPRLAPSPLWSTSPRSPSSTGKPPHRLHRRLVPPALHARARRQTIPHPPSSLTARFLAMARRRRWGLVATTARVSVAPRVASVGMTREAQLVHFI